MGNAISRSISLSLYTDYTLKSTHLPRTGHVRYRATDRDGGRGPTPPRPVPSRLSTSAPPSPLPLAPRAAPRPPRSRRPPRAGSPLSTSSPDESGTLLSLLSFIQSQVSIEMCVVQSRVCPTETRDGDSPSRVRSNSLECSLSENSRTSHRQREERRASSA